MKNRKGSAGKDCLHPPRSKPIQSDFLSNLSNQMGALHANIEKLKQPNDKAKPDVHISRNGSKAAAAAVESDVISIPARNNPLVRKGSADKKDLNKDGKYFFVKFGLSNF